MKTKLAQIIPFIILFFCIINMSFEPIFYDPKDMDSMEVLLEGSGRELAPQWGIERGLISKIRLTSAVMEELNEKTIPADAQLEATVDRISRILLGQKIMLFIYGFLILLSITSFLALYYKAWFYTYLNRSLYLISILPVLMSLQHPLRSISQTPIVGAISSVFLFVLTILLIYMLFMISKVYEEKEADRLTFFKPYKTERRENFNPRLLREFRGFPCCFILGESCWRESFWEIWFTFRFFFYKSIIRSSSEFY